MEMRECQEGDENRKERCKEREKGEKVEKWKRGRWRWEEWERNERNQGRKESFERKWKRRSTMCYGRMRRKKNRRLILEAITMSRSNVEKENKQRKGGRRGKEREGNMICITEVIYKHPQT